MPNFDLSFSIVTRDNIELQVSAQDSHQAIDLATEQILETLSSNQTLYLRNVAENTPGVTNGYTSLANLYASQVSSPPTSPSSLPEVAGYNRLIN